MNPIHDRRQGLALREATQRHLGVRIVLVRMIEYTARGLVVAAELTAPNCRLPRGSNVRTGARRPKRRRAGGRGCL